METSLRVQVQRILKIQLWYQFLNKGMYRIWARYYGVVVAAVALTLAASVALLLRTPQPTPFGYNPQWLFPVACVATVLLGYTLGRALGPLPVVLMAIVVPAVFVLTPAITGASEYYFAPDPEGPPTVDTNDMYQLFKGCMVSTCLVSMVFLTLRVVTLPTTVMGIGRWPFRRAMTVVIVVAAVVGLELLRITTAPLTRGMHVPWYRLVRHIMLASEPGWPKAIACWLWLTMAQLLAMYDNRLLPYLLHRVGFSWAPSRISTQEAYMIDGLLNALAKDPRLVVGRGKDGEEQRRGSRGSGESANGNASSRPPQKRTVTRSKSKDAEPGPATKSPRTPKRTGEDTPPRRRPPIRRREQQE